MNVRTTGISVVIPNYNGRQLLEAILPSAREALVRSGLPYEIIISDDCSTDNSVSYIKDEHPEISLIVSDVNAGFSPTINKGIFSTRYSYVLLLNNDVKLDPDYFSRLLRYFDSPDTFGVMGRIIGWDDDNIQDGGKYPRFHGAKIKTSGNYIPAGNDHNDNLYSMYLSGANALVSADKLLKLGGFDELFAPFYVEDFELCVRAWRLGWKCYYEHDAVCRHKLSFTIKAKNRKHEINRTYYRNKMYLHAMHLQGIDKIYWYLQLIPELLIRLLTGRFYFFQSITDFLRSGNRMRKSMDAFRKLAKQEGAAVSMKQVVTDIRESLSQKNIKTI